MFWNLKVLLIVHGQVNDGEVSKTIRGRSRRGVVRRGTQAPPWLALLSSCVPLCSPSATTLIAAAHFASDKYKLAVREVSRRRDIRTSLSLNLSGTA